MTEIVHEDDTTRPQTVTEDSNPRYHELLKQLEARTGISMLLNTWLDRRGGPMVCSPEDALEMFIGSDLQYLAIGGDGEKGINCTVHFHEKCGCNRDRNDDQGAFVLSSKRGLGGLLGRTFH